MSLEICVNMEPTVYEFDEKDLFDNSSKVYILGKAYDPKYDYKQIRNVQRNLFWMTYRRNFAPIGAAGGPTTDSGWGCMLRCGQMMLARTVSLILFGDDTLDIATKHPDEYQKILELFADNRKSLFSIHQIAQLGVSEGKTIEEWFGPNTCAQVLRKLVIFDNWLNIGIYVAMDNLFIVDDIRTVMRTRRKYAADEKTSETTKDAPVLILIPLRLGLTELTSSYIEAINQFFSLPSCVGIIGGRPNHALWFTGSCNDNLIYLDPHTCHNSVNFDEKLTPESVNTYHCEQLQFMRCLDLDPSMALGLLVRDEQELMLTIERIKEDLLPKSKPQLFEILTERPYYLPSFTPFPREQSPNPKEYAIMEPQRDTDEEFEVID